MKTSDIPWADFLAYCLSGNHVLVDDGDQLLPIDIKEKLYKYIADPNCDRPRYAFYKLSEKYHEKIVISKFDLALKKGYLDYGTSLFSPWVTDKGIEKLIELLREDIGNGIV